MQSNNKRIVKNTIYLYIRMLFLMIISLYTSRIVLQTLGISDYGVYNVVGGFVSLFAILTNSLSNAISRYITIEIGRHDIKRANNVFCVSVNLLLLMAIIVLIVSELFGIWFINCHLNVPPSRLTAARWVFQFSLLSFVIGLISIPYNGLIIAHERMSAFAFISIFEAVFKLLSIYIISIISCDKLILWAIMQSLSSIAIRLIYGVYCSKQFKECHYHLFMQRKIFKEMGFFAGWNFIGEAAGILRNQGVNVLLNLYFGPVVNAANGIAMQVNGMVSQFSGNFLTAVNPQIIKRYAEGNLNSSYSLVNRSAKFSFFLMLIIISPLLCETNFFLTLWLGKYPNEAVVFVQLFLVLSLIEILSYPIITLQRATGVVRDYQIVSGTIHLLNFPIAWLFLLEGFPAYWVYCIAIFLAIINTFARLYMLHRIVPVSMTAFYLKVLLRVLLVSLLSYLLISNLIFSHVFNIFLSIVLSGCVCGIMGLDKREKSLLIEFIKSKI